MIKLHELEGVLSEQGYGLVGLGIHEWLIQSRAIKVVTGKEYLTEIVHQTNFLALDKFTPDILIVEGEMGRTDEHIILIYEDTSSLLSEGVK